MAKSILVVDDEAGIRESLEDILKDEGFAVSTAESGEDALRMVQEVMPDMVFLDVWLPGMDGIEALDRMMRINPDLPVVMISGHGNVETAVKATKVGAYDFLEKPLSLERVILVARRALERKSLERENRELKESLGKRCRLVGETAVIKEVREQVFMAARSNSRVLITGESGVGKEIVAHILHERSPRAKGPFVEVNCAAIPHELIESELFGHEKGSFTGAFEQKKGKFELADSGTLFLDEIGDMALQTQAKLLRVLESQEFQRVGGSRSIKADIRVIAATNKDLSQLIKDQQFRDDLYFRINVIPLHIPPLRERRDDIALLVEYFLDSLAEEYGQAARKVRPEALKLLMAYDWPGNIRELKNVVERMVIMCRTEEIGPEAVRLEASAERDFYAEGTLRDARDAFEKEYITRKLAEHGWNISKTAEAIDIERSNLHRKIKGFGVELPE